MMQNVLKKKYSQYNTDIDLRINTNEMAVNISHTICHKVHVHVYAKPVETK